LKNPEEEMNEKIKLTLPVVVEGKYDKIKLDSIFDATVIVTGGFSVFNNKEKQQLLHRLCGGGVIILTDSDGGGKQIRSFLQGIIPKDKIHNLYIPKTPGKERRKVHQSKEGLLGVEGIEKDTLLKIFSPFISGEKAEKLSKMITKVDFFQDKLTGFENSSERRAKLSALADLPCDLTANALLEALNLLYGYEEYKALVEKLDV
jgi:ribonuclease M5